MDQIYDNEVFSANMPRCPGAGMGFRRQGSGTSYSLCFRLLRVNMCWILAVVMGGIVDFVRIRVPAVFWASIPVRK